MITTGVRCWNSRTGGRGGRHWTVEWRAWLGDRGGIFDHGLQPVKGCRVDLRVLSVVSNSCGRVSQRTMKWVRKVRVWKVRKLRLGNPERENLEMKDLLSMIRDCSSALTPALLTPSATHMFCRSLFIIEALFTLRTSCSGSM